jgi:hypothetical protein
LAENTTPLSWPTALRVNTLAAMLNFEFAGHEVFDGLELQWYDDDTHGTGMLVFLTRRDTGVVDYYHQPGLALDPGIFQLGAGVGVCRQTMFDDARLEIHDDGVRAEASFTDADGRRIEVRIDDRDGRRRKTGSFLAPVSDAITEPTSMLLVWVPRFDLVHSGGTAQARVDGVDLNIGAIPGERLWRRRLIKYGTPVETLELFPSASDDDGAAGAGESAVEPRLSFDPLLPDLNALSEGERREGSWSVATVESRLTGGTWFAHRTAGRVDVGLDVTERWQPGPLPLLIRVITGVVPVFRRWPTTYRWRATLNPDGSHTAAWTRTGTAGAGAYRKATGTSDSL